MFDSTMEWFEGVVLLSFYRATYLLEKTSAYRTCVRLLNRKRQILVCRSLRSLSARAKSYLSLLAVTGCAVLASETLQAQQLARYPISTANSFNSPSVSPTQVAPNITASPLSPTGVDPLHHYIGFEGHLLFRDWSGGIAPDANDKYLSFTITPNPGFKVRFSTITYTLGSRVTNASWQLRSSVDNYTANFGAHATQPGPDADQYVFTDDASSLGAQSGPVTFRLYGYNEVSTNYSGLLNNVNMFGGQRGTDVLVNGTVSEQPPSTSAVFLGKDTATQGNWGGAYSVDGHNIINHSVNYPSYATVIPIGKTDFTWASSTSDVRALRKKGATTDRIAACWYSASNFTVDLNLTDGLSHRVALYCLDWNTTVRAQQIDILDAFDNSVLSSQSVTGFNGGQYLIWELKGHLLIRLTNTGSPNAVLSGIFFDPSGEPPPPPPARTLTIASSNPASGVSVTISPNDNNAQGNGSTAFTRTYNNSTQVTLTAPSTAGGNNFAKWQRDGVDASTTVSTTVIMDANHTMTAVYVVPPPPPRTLTVASSNPASGVSVTVSPNDNNAQGNGSTSFTRTYNNNTQVTLTAPSTAGGNNFAKWQRDGVDAGTTISTTVIMDANHTMTAVYVVPPPPPRTLTVASSNPRQRSVGHHQSQ